MSIHHLANTVGFGGGGNVHGFGEAGQARRSGHGHHVNGHGNGHSQAAQSEESGFSFHAHMRGAMGEDGPGKSAQSPAHQVAFYFSASFGSGAEGLDSFENFGQAISDFLHGLLTLTSEADTPALPPADDGGASGEIPDAGEGATDGEAAAIVAPAEDGEGESEVAAAEDTPVEAAPAEDAAGDGDAGIVVPPANVDGSAEAELLDALFDDGEEEEQAAV